MSTTSVAIHWRLTTPRNRLMGSACADCGHKMFPPREVCPECARHQAELVLQMPLPKPVTWPTPQAEQPELAGWNSTLVNS